MMTTPTFSEICQRESSKNQARKMIIKKNTTLKKPMLPETKSVDKALIATP
jgi:hypothetical protein